MSSQYNFKKIVVVPTAKVRAILNSKLHYTDTGLSLLGLHRHHIVENPAENPDCGA